MSAGATPGSGLAGIAGQRWPGVLDYPESAQIIPAYLF
jgi:hypothetical protein